MIVLLSTSFASAFQVYGLLNTGVDDAGAVLPLHAVEQHYSVSGPVSVAYVVPQVSMYANPPFGSAWIGPNATSSTYPSDPEGNYAYTVQFNLTEIGSDLLELSGLWATDNSAQLWFNGHFTGSTKGLWGFTQFDPFTIRGGLVEGLNTLEFRIENELIGPNPTALCVANLQIKAVPEPSAFAFFSVCTIAGIAFRAGTCTRKKNSSSVTEDIS